ncbi:MAG TPA: hypothetical protein VI112_08220 [Bacteroidia bacterium]|jgi:hypothetical protein
MKNLFLFFSIALALVACAPSALVPCTTNAPGPEKRHDGHVSMQGNLGHVELQSSYSPVEHFGLCFNSYLTLFRKSNDKGTDQWQASAGYYLIKNKCGFDIYGGFGSGIRSRSGDYGVFPDGENASCSVIDSRYKALMIQSDIYSSWKNNLQEVFSAQFNRFFFNDFDYTNIQNKYHGQEMDHHYRLERMSQDLLVLSMTYKIRFKTRFSFFIQPGAWICFPFLDEVEGSNPGTYLSDHTGFLNHTVSRPFLYSGFIYHFHPKEVVKKRRLETNSR